MKLMLVLVPSRRQYRTAISFLLSGHNVLFNTRLRNISENDFRLITARPLKRAIQKKIETPLGRLLLQGAIRDGQTVVVDAGGPTGDLMFTPEAVAV